MSGVQQQRLGITDNRAIESVEEFEFEPIKGYPMLQWHGKRPFRTTHFYPAQLKEVHGPEVEGWRNKLFWGDNLQVMGHLLKQYRGQMKLVYIDPPFDSKAEYKKQVKFSGQYVSNDISSFEEKQYSDIWINDEYLQFMYERLIIIRELISRDGCIYLHCDWHKSHYLRCILDEVFGADDFQNEIIWKRTTSQNSARRYGSIHDTLLFYTKSADYLWNKVYTQYDDEYLNRFHYTDPDGRQFGPISLIAAGVRNGATGRPWRGINVTAMGNHWRCTVDKLDILDADGRIYWPPDSGFPRLKFYLDEARGNPLQDMWTDLPPVNSQAKERASYPTQKPENLLERIISASSNPGDIVFDCFMGSGTTQAAAMKLGRRFIGADINLGAMQITTKRLLQVAEGLVITKTDTQKPQQAAIVYDDSADEDNLDADSLDSEEGTIAAPPVPTVYYTGFEVYNVNYYDIFRNPVQAKDLLLQALEVQPLAAGSVFDGTNDGRMVKVMPVNRIATRADLNDLLANIDHKSMDRLYQENPNRVVEKITLVCMGHEPDLAAYLKQELHPYKVDVEVVDVLRDRQDLQFKRDSEARVKIKGGELVIEAFYPMNLLQKFSMQKDAVEDWRELVESVMIDWNYDGAILTPALVDIPERNEMVRGTYKVPDDAGTIRVKITDLLSESWEGIVTYG